jgi:hypothetical protein
MIKIGVFGESPYDTDAICNLLTKPYAGRFSFVKLLRRISSEELSSIGKMRRILKAEISSRTDVSAVIVVLDLDSHGQDAEALREKKAWFEKLNESFPQNGLLLLNVYELEALILADIETFNRLFRTSIKFKGDPMAQKDPKEYLVRATRSYRRTFAVKDNPEVFSNLNIDQVKQKCRYFKEFIQNLELLDRSS